MKPAYDPKLPAPPRDQPPADEPPVRPDAHEPNFDRAVFVHITDWPVYAEAAWQFDGCRLASCSFGGQESNLAKVKIWDTTLTRCDLSAARALEAGLVRASLGDCRATGLQLGGGTLKDVSFKNCKLDMASFRLTKLERVRFEDCVLDDADFNEAHLRDVSFVRCSLVRTEFSKARLERVDLRQSPIGELRGVASLGGAIITPEQTVALAPLFCTALGIVIED